MFFFTLILPQLYEKHFNKSFSQINIFIVTEIQKDLFIILEVIAFFLREVSVVRPPDSYHNPYVSTANFYGIATIQAGEDAKLYF